VLGHDYCEEVAERCTCDCREEKMATWLYLGSFTWSSKAKSVGTDVTLTRQAQERKKSAGLSTCSTTSIEVTMSNVLLSSISVSDVVCLYSNGGSTAEDRGLRKGSCEACADAILIFEEDASIARVLAPIRARVYNTTVNLG
jgi:hypothetical protein